MRNGTSHLKHGAWALLTLTAIAVIGGCQNPQPTEIEHARALLNGQKYEDASAAADTYLAKDANSPLSAEAYYIKGRALEMTPNKSVEEARTHLQQARYAYINALKAGPTDRNLEGVIRSSIANVAYWQDDYATAAEQWTTAYGMMDDANTRARALLRTGISQQRLGEFEAADRTFGMVVQQFPGTDPAARAQARIGARAFNVQLTFSQASVAAMASVNLAKLGLPINRVPTNNGQSIVLIGPFSSYAQASAARTRVASEYSMAQIVP